MPRFLLCIFGRCEMALLCCMICCMITPELRRQGRFCLFFLRSSKITIFFKKFIRALFLPSWKSTDSTPWQSQNSVKNFFSLNGRGKIFLVLALFYAKLECFLSILGWCKESTIYHLWQYTKSLSDHMRPVSEISGLRRLVLVYSYQVWVPILHTLSCNPQWQEHITQSCGKPWYCIYSPTYPKFFGHIWELQTPHILFHQSKHPLADHFFHRREYFPTSPREICVPTNIQCIQASCLHRTHFVATCVWLMQKHSLPWGNVPQRVLRIHQTLT